MIERRSLPSGSRAATRSSARMIPALALALLAPLAAAGPALAGFDWPTAAATDTAPGATIEWGGDAMRADPISQEGDGVAEPSPLAGIPAADDPDEAAPRRGPAGSAPIRTEEGS